MDKQFFFGNYDVKSNNNDYIDIYVNDIIKSNNDYCNAYLFDGKSGVINFYNNIDSSYFGIDLSKIENYEHDVYNSYYIIKYKRPKTDFYINKFYYEPLQFNAFNESIYLHSIKVLKANNILSSRGTKWPNFDVYTLENIENLSNKIKITDKVAYIDFTFYNSYSV